MRLFALCLAILAPLVPVRDASAHGRFPELGRIAFHPTDDDVFLVRGTFGLVATRDGGATFRWICPTVFGGRWTEDPAITIAQDGSFVVGVFDGLARGTSQGCDWDQPSTDLVDEVVIDVARTADAARIFALESSGARPNGLWISDDSGASWSATNDAIDPILFETVRVAPSDPTRVYLTGAYPPSVDMPRRPFVYASDDGGMTFDAVAFTDFRDGDRNVYLLGVDPLDAERALIRVRADGDDRVYETADGGQTFTEVFAIPSVDGFAWSDDGANVWIGSRLNTTLHRSDDGGRSFVRIRDDLTVSCLGVRRDELFVCADNFADGYGLGVSDDGGTSFDPLFVFEDIGGLVECPSGADTPAVCEPELPDLEFDLGLAGDAGPPDAGVVDSSTPPDGSLDSGTDAGASPDASAPDGSLEPGGGGGCACSTEGDGAGSGWLLLGVLFLCARRRRDADRQR